MNKFFIVFISFILFCIASLNAQDTTSIAVYFDYNQDRLIPKEEKKLIRFIDTVAQNQINNIHIFAYCDHQGSDKYNHILSTKRANHVQSIILKNELDSNLILSAKGLGEITPPQKLSEDKLAQNRRAEIKIIYTKPTPPPTTKLTIKTDTLIEYDPHKNPIITKDLKVGDKITLDDILFVGSRHVLLSESYPSLKKLTAALKYHKNYNIIILGHICCTKPGRDGRDMDTGLINLSTARAETIYNYLIENGISSDRLEFKGMKGDLPTGLGDKFDRRVEIEISAIN